MHGRAPSSSLNTAIGLQNDQRTVVPQPSMASAARIRVAMRGCTVLCLKATTTPRDPFTSMRSGAQRMSRFVSNIT